MKIALLFGLIMLGYVLTHKDWDKSGARERDTLQPIEQRLSLSDSIPVIVYEYPPKQFGAVELTKRDEQDLERYGCYNPLF